MKSSKKQAILALYLLALFALPCLAFAANGQDKVGAEHRSAVAEIVSQLNSIAGKDNNIGEEIRQVAQEQSTSTENVAAKIDKIESRSKIKTFLIGSDYKNLGALRSEMVTSANQISRLEKALERAATSTDEVKTELTAQINAMEQEQTKVETFIQGQEGKFSLFGWLVKFFNR